VVVGSGLGGLTCAAYLCAAGRRTLVLEGHVVAGGNSQAFRRSIHGHDYEFDVGVHYIGECGPGGLISRILHGLGLAERVVFRPLDPDGYSTLVFPGLTFRVPVGWERYRARLLSAFPAEAGPLGELLDVFERVGDEGRALQNREIQPAEMGTRAPTLLRWGLRPVPELFAHYRISEAASAVLLGEQGDYAVRPSRTPVALAAGLTDHYMRGAFYPEGGGQAMVGRLVEAIRAFGGEVRTRSPVARIRVENGRAVGVELARGPGFVEAPVVVSNADLKRTVLELVGEDHFRPETVERVRAFRMSLPLFAVYLGVEIDVLGGAMPNTNWWLWPNTDIDGLYAGLEAGEMPEPPVVYLTVTSLRDPESPQVAPPGHANLQVMTLVPPDYAHWALERGPAEGGRYHRDPEYRRRKQALAERLVAEAERVIPGLAEHVEWKEAATPVTQERFTHSTGGTSYGIEFATDQMGPMRLGPETDVPGLFLCGASTPSGHGIANVMRSGVVAAAAVLEVDLLAELRAGRVLGDPARLPPLRPGWDAWRESH
jgi:phytoene dehydrogenase-like protein